MAYQIPIIVQVEVELGDAFTIFTVILCPDWISDRSVENLEG